MLCNELRSTWYRIVDLKIAVAKFGTAVSAECRPFHALIYDFLIDAIEIVVGHPPSSEIDVRLDQPYSFSDFIRSRYAAFSFCCVK